MQSVVVFGIVTFGLAGLGLVALVFAFLAAARFGSDWLETRRMRREHHALGPFRAGPELRAIARPSIGGASYLLAAALIGTLAALLCEREAMLTSAVVARPRAVSPPRLLAGDPGFAGIGHVLRMSAPVTGVGGDQTGDVIRIVVYGAVAMEALAHLSHVSSDIDRASVENRRDHAVIEMYLVAGRRPRWSVEAIGDCVVIHLHRADDGHD